MNRETQGGRRGQLAEDFFLQPIINKTNVNTPTVNNTNVNTPTVNNTSNKKYYGNSTPVSKNPYIITLQNVDVLYWREKIEWGTAGCGNPGVKEQKKNKCSPIEAPDKTDTYRDMGFPCDPIFGRYDSFWWVKEPFLTHVFGSGTSAGATIPKSGNQYDDQGQTALSKGITPFNKIMQHNYNNYINVRYRDYGAARVLPKPKFASIQFNIPDPTEPNLDSIIPYILYSYFVNDQLTMPQLNDYMVKYAFTPINEDNKIIPRYKQRIGNNIVPHLPSTIIDLWIQRVGNSFFNNGALNYCSGDILNTEFCYEYCMNPTNNCDNNLLAFCRTGGTENRNLPGITKGILSKTPVTFDMLKEAYPRYFDINSNRSCGCFMPDQFYDYLDQYSFQKINTTPEDFKELYERKVIGVGGAKCNPFSSCSGADIIKRKSEINPCPSINLQKCIQTNNVQIEGNAEQNTFENEQLINCVQNVETNLPSKVAADNAEREKAAAAQRTQLEEAAAKTAADKAAAVDQRTQLEEAADKAAATPVSDRATPSTPGPAPASSAKMSPVMIAIIVAIILALIGGGAFFALR